MAGMAANISAFNAVFTYDLWQDYMRKDRPDDYYLMVGRWATVGGVAIAIGTALIASGFSNISDYLQTLFGFFNVPLFARSSSACSGSAPAAGRILGDPDRNDRRGRRVRPLQDDVMHVPQRPHETLWGAIAAFVAGAITVVVVTPGQAPKPEEQLAGLVQAIRRTSCRMKVRNGGSVIRCSWAVSPSGSAWCGT